MVYKVYSREILRDSFENKNKKQVVIKEGECKPIALTWSEILVGVVRCGNMEDCNKLVPDLDLSLTIRGFNFHFLAEIIPLVMCC